MHLLREGFLWLDADALRYWSLAWACLGVTAWAAWRTPAAAPATGRRWDSLLFLFGVPITLAAFRWPVWFFPTELNPDESQTIAGAITLLQNPVYWKSVDGTTHGPLCEYPLVLAGWLGAPMNYVTARVIGTAMQAASLLASWGALRCWFGDRVARLATLPALVFWCGVTWDDFVHYSSEVPGLFFLSLGAWFASRAVTPGPGGWQRGLLAGLGGLCLGAVPFAKLQVVPLALAIGLLACGVTWLRFAATDRRRLLTLLIGGALIPGAIVATGLTIYGLWGHFLPSYIVSNFAYVGLRQHLPLRMPGQFFNFSATEPAFAWFFWGSLLHAVFYARNLATYSRERAICWGLLGLAFYCVFRPGREAAHYLQILVWPLTLLTGATLAAAAAELRDGKFSPTRRLAPFLWLGFFALLPQAYHRLVSWHRFTGHLVTHLQPRQSSAVAYVQRHAKPGDSMALWGWESSLLVATGLPHGTREAHTANLFVEWPLRDYFTNRYLWDMERHRPAWFVDAVGPGAFMYDNRSILGHETVPRLRTLIESDYALVAEFENKRIYRRKPAAGP